MHKYLRHFPHRSHFLLFFIQVTAAEGEASEEQSLAAAAAPGTAAVHGSGGGENAGTGA